MTNVPSRSVAPLRQAPPVGPRNAIPLPPLPDVAAVPSVLRPNVPMRHARRILTPIIRPPRAVRGG